MGIPSYSAARISGCRNASSGPLSRSTPARIASSRMATRSLTRRPDTTARSDTEKSIPSSAATRTASRTGAERNSSRSAIAADSDSGARRPIALHTAVLDHQRLTTPERVQ